MSIGYNSIEDMVDREIKNKRREKEKIKRNKEYDDSIKAIFSEVQDNGLTLEQNFLIKYYGINEKDIIDIEDKKFNTSNADQTLSKVTDLGEDELEIARYEALIDLKSFTTRIDMNEENKCNDRFHKRMTTIDEYVSDIETNPLIIKKLRNLQLLNRMAHQYESIFKSKIEQTFPKLYDEYSEYYKKRVLHNIDELFSNISEDVELVKKKLAKETSPQMVKNWEEDDVIKSCVRAKKWMFGKKIEYIEDVLEQLQDNSEGINYGMLNDSIVFDVPEYGQFCVHTGKKNLDRIKEYKIVYGVPDYNGKFLGDVNILFKADKELLEKTSYEELSDLDQQRYRILTQKMPKATEKNKESLEELIDGANDKNIASEIVQKIINAGLEPEKVATKKLLNISSKKANELVETLKKLRELKIDSDIIYKYPNFLANTNVKKVESVYNVLKEYGVDTTNSNFLYAFESDADNLRENLDLAIENGLYEFAQKGVVKFIKGSSKNLNMKMNLLKKFNEPMILETKNKRKISATFYKTEKELKEIYGIDKSEIFEELSHKSGQDFLQNNRYYFEEIKKVDLDEEQKALSDGIYEKIAENQMENNLILKIGKYNYSSIKVRRQIDSIIANFGIHSLENENTNEILEYSLLKDKNIDKNEVDEISSIISEKTKEENKIRIYGQKDDELKMDEQESDELEMDEPENDELEMDEQESDEPEMDEQESDELEMDEQENDELEMNEQEGDEPEIEELEENSKFEEIKEMTAEMSERRQNLEQISQIIDNLKNIRKTLKKQIDETELKIEQKILNSEESEEQIIEDIKKLRKIIVLQKEKRKEVKKMIKMYKENNKMMEYTLNQEKRQRDNELDDIEL